MLRSTRSLWAWRVCPLRAPTCAAAAETARKAIASRTVPMARDQVYDGGEPDRRGGDERAVQHAPAGGLVRPGHAAEVEGEAAHEEQQRRERPESRARRLDLEKLREHRRDDAENDE